MWPVTSNQWPVEQGLFWNIVKFKVGYAIEATNSPVSIILLWLSATGY